MVANRYVAIAGGILLLGSCSEPSVVSGPTPVIPPSTRTPEPFDASTEPPDTTEVAFDWWKQGAAACPPGGSLEGAAPPQGRHLRCLDAKKEPHGPEASWDDAGHLLSISRNVEGRTQGKEVGFYADGTKRIEGTYLRGLRHGTWTEWHPNGKVFTTGSWRSNRPDGEHVYFAADDRELGRTTLTAGNGRWVVWDPAGYRRQEYVYVQGQLHGSYTEWYPNGARKTEGQWAADARHGTWTRWDEQGRQRAVEQFRDGTSVGTWTWWDERGQVSRIVVYDDGETIVDLPHRNGKPLAVLPGRTRCDTKAGLEKVAGRQCVDRVPRVPGLVMIGSFADDRGCMLEGYLWDCARRNGAPRPRDVLRRAGWAIATGKDKEDLALEYLREVYFAYEGSVSSQPDRPKVVVAADGSAVVTLWLQEPSDMDDSSSRDLLEIRIARNGTVRQKKLRTQRDD